MDVGSSGTVRLTIHHSTVLDCYVTAQPQSPPASEAPFLLAPSFPEGGFFVLCSPVVGVKIVHYGTTQSKEEESYFLPLIFALPPLTCPNTYLVGFLPYMPSHLFPKMHPADSYLIFFLLFFAYTVFTVRLTTVRLKKSKTTHPTWARGLGHPGRTCRSARPNMRHQTPRHPPSAWSGRAGARAPTSGRTVDAASCPLPSGAYLPATTYRPAHLPSDATLPPADTGGSV